MFYCFYDQSADARTFDTWMRAITVWTYETGNGYVSGLGIQPDPACESSWHCLCSAADAKQHTLRIVLLPDGEISHLTLGYHWDPNAPLTGGMPSMNCINFSPIRKPDILRIKQHDVLLSTEVRTMAHEIGHALGKWR
jgi:hypothetical protein